MTDASKDVNVQESKFKLARTVTLGDIGVCATMVIAAFSAYSSLDKRVEKVEYAQQVQEGRTKESLLDLKVDVKEVQSKLSEVQRDIARIPPSQVYTIRQPKERN